MAEARRFCRKTKLGSVVCSLTRALDPRIGVDLMECTVDGKQIRDVPVDEPKAEPKAEPKGGSKKADG